MKSLLFAFVLLYISSFVYAHDCEKVSNSTDCVWYDDSDFGTFVSSLSNLKLVPVSNDGSRVTYSACISPFISKICINVEFDPWGDFFQNVTLSITVDKITIWSFETTLPELMEPNGGLCLDDDTVLEILALIPALQDDIQIILGILEATGCEPRGLFSMCFYFNNCTTTDGAIDIVLNEEAICGCFEFDFQLLYWRKFCLYKFKGNIGCVGEQTFEQKHEQLPTPKEITQNTLKGIKSAFSDKRKFR